jgi:hypothetical protein
MFSQLVSANPKGANTTGMNHIGVSPLLIPQGQLRIYLGAAHRFIWPVHLAGWLELGWTTEPRATPRATSGATRTPSKTRRSNKEKNLLEPNPIEINPVEANLTNESPLGVASAKAVDPLPPTQISVAATDFTVDESTPTFEADD